jgi:dihydroorotase
MAMVGGIAAGEIDIIVSSHDPQDADMKRRPFAEAADGAIGLETLLSAALRLVHSGDLTLPQLLRPLTSNPAKLFGLPAGRLEKNAPADLILFDPNEPWVLNKDNLKSRSKNTPFDEAKMQGRVLRTVVAGATVFQA